jgi:glycosyltransferase involved in cell wall biosynthesis
MKNVLFISYDGMTDPLGQSQVIPYLKGLTKYGYRFTILSCDKPDKYLLHKEMIYDILKAYPIKWVSIPYHKNPPVLSAFYDTIMLKKKAVHLHQEERFDMVHTRAGTPALIGLWLKKKYGVKFLNDLRDFFSDSRVDSGSWNLNNPVFRKVYHYFKKQESEAIKMNDGIVCLTRAAEKIIKKSPEYNDKTPLQVIPCSVDLNLFDPKKIDIDVKNKFAKALAIEEGDYIFSYLGTIKDWNMMSFFKSILNSIPRAKFLLITPDQPEPIIKKSMEFGISREKMIIMQAQRSEVPVMLSFSKYSVFFIQPCYSIQAASPTKHGEIMAMGIPVITNDGIGDVAEIINRYNSGIVLSDFKEETFNTTTESLLKQKPFDPHKIRDGAQEYYDLNIAILKYKEIYELILNP